MSSLRGMAQATSKALDVFRDNGVEPIVESKARPNGSQWYGVLDALDGVKLCITKWSINEKLWTANQVRTSTDLSKLSAILDNDTTTLHALIDEESPPASAEREK